MMPKTATFDTNRGTIVAELYDKAAAKAAGSEGSALARAALREVNAKLIAVERALTLNEGLPSRPWFKHQIYAPGLYTGYGVKTLPQIREGLEEGHWDEAKEGVTKIAAAVNGLAEQVDRASAGLARAVR